MNKIHYKKIEAFFGFTRQTWKKWGEQKRFIFQFVTRYLDDQKIDEFVQSGKISEFENYKKIETAIFKKNRIKYLETFIDFPLDRLHSNFLEFYFQFLSYCHFKENFDEDLKTLKYKFLAIYSSYCVLKNKYTNPIDNEDMLDSLIPYLDLFENWDDSMLIFLNHTVDCSFTNLLSENDCIKLQNIANLHISYFQKYKEYFQVKTLSDFYFDIEHKLSYSV